MPRVDRYEGGEVAPGKAGIGRNAGVDDRIVAVTLAIEIILGITGGIVVHVDETGARLAMIVMMDHRIMSKAQLPCRGFEQAFDGGKIAGLLDFSQKRRRAIQRVRGQTFDHTKITAFQPFHSSLPYVRRAQTTLPPP